jgi:hypothetical protein
MAEDKVLQKNLSIYIPDREIFEKLCEETCKLWYGKTGKVMTKSEVLIKALLYFKSFLSDEEEATPSYAKGVKSIGRLRR